AGPSGLAGVRRELLANAPRMVRHVQRPLGRGRGAGLRRALPAHVEHVPDRLRRLFRGGDHRCPSNDLAPAGLKRHTHAGVGPRGHALAARGGSDMLLYRLLCALLLAWAAGWSLARPEAAALVMELPEMSALGPASAAFVGFVSLSARQGWGIVVAFANGIWAGALSIGIAGTLYMLIALTQAVRDGLISSFDRFVLVFSDNVEPLIEQLANLPLLIVSLGA